MTSGPGEVQEARYTGGTPDGEDFPISPGEGLIVYATREKTLNFASAFCPTTWDLHAGANLVGTPCGPASLTAFDLLETIGDEAVVSSIQRFNSLAGRFETVAYSNGEPAGVDFPIVGGKGYVVTMKQERLGFRP
jgi:hypothetical protein